MIICILNDLIVMKDTKQFKIRKIKVIWTLKVTVKRLIPKKSQSKRGKPSPSPHHKPKSSTYNAPLKRPSTSPKNSKKNNLSKSNPELAKMRKNSKSKFQSNLLKQHLF
jgi:hypothetical protein